MRGRGRARALSVDEERQALAMYIDTKIAVAKIAKSFEVCPKTIYNVIARHKKALEEAQKVTEGAA